MAFRTTYGASGGAPPRAVSGSSDWLAFPALAVAVGELRAAPSAHGLARRDQARLRFLRQPIEVVDGEVDLRDELAQLTRCMTGTAPDR